MNKIAAGVVETKNPFNGVVEKVSLKPKDVEGIVFWSRNLAPMVSDFSTLYAAGYSFYFQMTLIGYPGYVDPGSPKIEVAAKTAKTLRNIFGPRSVVWRYDPIALTSDTDAVVAQGEFCVDSKTDGRSNRHLRDLFYRQLSKNGKELLCAPQKSWCGVL